MIKFKKYLVEDTVELKGQKYSSAQDAELLQYKDVTRKDYNSTDWQSEYDSQTSTKDRNRIVDEFLLLTYGESKLKQIEDGISIIYKIFEELGFNETDNPFIKFLHIILNKSTSVKINYNDWLALNNLYADLIITSADLVGTGYDKENHIIFNTWLYSREPDMEELVELYKDLRDKYEVDKLNLYVIGEQFKEYDEFLNIADKDSGKLKSDSDLSKVRDIFIYANPKELDGPLYTYSFIKKAISVGFRTKSKSSIKKRDGGYAEDYIVNNLVKELKETIIDKILKQQLVKKTNTNFTTKEINELNTYLNLLVTKLRREINKTSTKDSGEVNKIITLLRDFNKITEQDYNKIMTSLQTIVGQVQQQPQTTLSTSNQRKRSVQNIKNGVIKTTNNYNVLYQVLNDTIKNKNTTRDIKQKAQEIFSLFDVAPSRYRKQIEDVILQLDGASENDSTELQTFLLNYETNLKKKVNKVGNRIKKELPNLLGEIQNKWTK